ncbi:RagB/SusD family nutrient uptake outer membrane protein [uncultured Phocaeicola sp.]|uniref:RagB/SusD family nutrient uptake outer membrane protein n=1 Tax=uncultured Phocaeicola sp. TaxID=990718 RepID=UPI0025FE7913|nr:RagB/SusD family nutrient uptake outer membrane protein [uncultured Phocaeicola sp.]
MKKIVYLILAAATLTTGCDDLFEPAIENNKALEDGRDDPVYAEGILANAYTRNPYNSQSFNDVATDDAVTNQTDNTYLLMATGSWTSNNNPMNQWDGCKAAIQYINMFLSEVDQTTFADDELINQLFRNRLKGEAYGLRAMNMFYLLQAHAGWTADGQLLGVPIINEMEDVSSNFNMPRNTFDECIKAIYDDVDAALEILPLDYEDIASDAEMPQYYRELGADYTQFNRVFGAMFRTRMSGRIALAFRAKAALLAASPAFTEGSEYDWEDAANENGELLRLIGGVAGLSPTGNTWYKNGSEIDALGAGENPQEMLWRNGKNTNNYDLEVAQFPPSLLGGGQINPTQNLVDAFPMANGYPIDDPHSGYNDQDPYTGRDPRLALYIVTNGSAVGTSGSIIDTSVDNTTNNDGLNRENGVSTRTGYYLRKHLREDVVLNASGSHNGQAHYSPRIRYTEIFLNYAEAANEAWGPQGSGSFGFSAYDVIKAIRQRAGVGTDNGDAYLESIKGDQGKMRELIRNERRLELCFEGFRFWDIRRWGLPMNEPAMGMRISGGTYTPFEVETRTYQDYMQYGPVPYSEMLKFNALEQNQGW